MKVRPLPPCGRAIIRLLTYVGRSPYRSALPKNGAVWEGTPLAEDGPKRPEGMSPERWQQLLSGTVPLGPGQGNWSALDGKPIWSPPPGPQPNITVPPGSFGGKGEEAMSDGTDGTGSASPKESLFQFLRRGGEIVDVRSGTELSNMAKEPSGPSSSEGGPLPTTWREAIPYVVWVVLVLGFGLELVAAFVRGEWVHFGVAAGGLVTLMTAALHWKQAVLWARSLSPNWAVGALVALLLALIFSRFVEEKRWPFLNQIGTAVIQSKLDAANRQLQELREAKPLNPPDGTVSGLLTANEIKELRSKVDELTRQRDAAQHDAAKVTSSPMPLTSLAPLHDREWKRVRQEANRDISAYLDGPFQTFADAASAANAPALDTVGSRLHKLENLKLLLATTMAYQNRMLTKYNGITDVFELTDWNMLARVFDPAIDEYISTLKPLPPDEPFRKFGSLPSLSKFGYAVENIPRWINDTQRAVGNKRHELEETVVKQ